VVNPRRLFWPAIVAGALGVLVVLLGLTVLAGAVIRTCCRVGPKAREAVLRTDLRTFRDVIDQFHADRGVYPPSFEALVAEGYLRTIPVDPMTKSAATWVPVLRTVGARKQLVNVRSGSTARGSDGRSYSEW
jgi:general secretion pathway protein G